MHYAVIEQLVSKMMGVSAWTLYSHGKDSEKERVFRHALKTGRESATVNCRGRLFQEQAATTRNAWLPGAAERSWQWYAKLGALGMQVPKLGQGAKPRREAGASPRSRSIFVTDALNFEPNCK